jgi:hypothetical protein
MKIDDEVDSLERLLQLEALPTLALWHYLLVKAGFIKL